MGWASGGAIYHAVRAMMAVRNTPITEAKRTTFPRIHRDPFALSQGSTLVMPKSTMAMWQCHTDRSTPHGWINVDVGVPGARIGATFAPSCAFLVQWLERFTSTSVCYEEVTRSIRVEGSQG